MRESIHTWAKNTLGATGDFDVLPLIGSKEFVAWLPTFLESRKVLFPEIAYPTYNVGAMMAKAISIPVDFDASQWPVADLAWVNTPSNPTGRVHTRAELLEAISYSRKNKTVLACDECYLEFGYDKTPFSILSLTEGNNQNILAVHSLSKRSSLAGYRAGFVIGDSDLIAKIREVRKHAGMMVALPIQLAMIAALSDSTHVQEQRDRYNARREALTPALIRHGFRIDESHAGLYIWCTRDEDSWESVDWLANLGILATPGSFYGSSGAKHIRVALTATDAQINQALARLNQTAS
ncbi:unannotated protein [freshwater metagenome]|uniref:Unannotated protein n=1 Tax=freshwater metagenome TaxID=449393 RepID=A0A6J7XPD3_9ZZZZ